MNEPLSSLPDADFDQLVAEAVNTQIIEARPRHAIFERLKTFEQLYSGLEVTPTQPALLYRDPAEDSIKVALLTKTVTIGRDSQCDVPFPRDTHLSRRHVSISMEEGLFILKDEGSHNGTFVNGQMEPVKEHVLREGDIITAGQQTLVFTTGKAYWEEEQAPEG